MKQIIICLTTLLILFSCSSKTKELQKSINVTAIVDITDRRQLYPNAEAFLPLFDFNNQENNEARFRLCMVTDRELNPDIEISLLSGDKTEKRNTEDDIDFRKKLIAQFFTSIRSSVKEFNSKNTADSSLDFSECFKTIAVELNKITQNTVDNSALVVFSDIQEKSTIFDSYSSTKRDMIFSNPEKVTQIFEKTKLLPESLQNVSVFFVYNPTSREDDRNFMAMVKVYKILLERRGANVFVQANNQKFKL